VVRIYCKRGFAVFVPDITKSPRFEPFGLFSGLYFINQRWKICRNLCRRVDLFGYVQDVSAQTDRVVENSRKYVICSLNISVFFILPDIVSGVKHFFPQESLIVAGHIGRSQ